MNNMIGNNIHLRTPRICILVGYKNILSFNFILNFATQVWECTLCEMNHKAVQQVKEKIFFMRKSF
jgi:hypothetical protein